MPHDPMPDWNEEARDFLERLKTTSLPEGFSDGFRPTESEMAWFASMTIHGPLGLFELRLWTTPGLAGVGQARLTLLPNDTHAIKACGETTMPVLQCEGIEEFSPLVAFLRLIVESVDTKNRLLQGLRIAADPRHRAKRDETVAHVRAMKAPLKPKDGSS